MERYTQFLLKHKKLIIGVFVLAAVLCAVLSGLVGVNYNFADYPVSYTHLPYCTGFR